MPFPSTVDGFCIFGLSTPTSFLFFHLQTVSYGIRYGILRRKSQKMKSQQDKHLGKHNLELRAGWQGQGGGIKISLQLTDDYWATSCVPIRATAAHMVSLDTRCSGPVSSGSTRAHITQQISALISYSRAFLSREFFNVGRVSSKLGLEWGENQINSRRGLTDCCKNTKRP